MLLIEYLHHDQHLSLCVAEHLAVLAREEEDMVLAGGSASATELELKVTILELTSWSALRASEVESLVFLT